MELTYGKKIGEYALDAACQSDLAQVIIVSRPQDGQVWLPLSFSEMVSKGRCTLTVCKEADKGMSYSIRHGLAEAEKSDPDGVMILLADQPFVSKEMINRLLESFCQNPRLDFIASSLSGIARPPIVFSRNLFATLKKLEGDQGARNILRNSELKGKLLEEKDETLFWDADTQEDVLRLKQKLKRMANMKELFT